MTIEIPSFENGTGYRFSIYQREWQETTPLSTKKVLNLHYHLLKIYSY